MPREAKESRANGELGAELLRVATIMRRRRKELVALEAEYESLLDDVERSAAENDAGTDRLLDDINAAPGDGWVDAKERQPWGGMNVAVLCSDGRDLLAWWNKPIGEWRGCNPPYEITGCEVIAWNENPRAPLPTRRQIIPHAIRAADSDAAANEDTAAADDAKNNDDRFAQP